MKLIASVTLSALVLGLAGLSVVANAQAQAQHNEFPLQIIDYNDCTDELVSWDAVVREVVVNHQNPGGRGLFVSHWLWDGLVEGQDSGYIWSSHGTSPYVETYSVDNFLTGGFVLIENSVLHPETPGAPRIKLDVNIRMRFNANGDLVVDQVQYTYDCRSH